VDPTVELAGVQGDVTSAEGELAAARTRIAELTADPALAAQPPDRLTQERNAWRVHRDAERTPRRVLAPAASSPRPTRSVRPPEPALHRAPLPGTGPGIGR
jgi:exodeoxyribonuclease V alpha subunit